MEPKKYFTCVMTPSKAVALIIFIALPFLGFYLGMQYIRPTPLLPSPDKQTNEVSSLNVNYSCDSGKTISARYTEGKSVVPVNPGEPPVPNGKVWINLSDGRKLSLDQTLSADGSRYANQDESFIFWSKGKEVIVMEGNKQDQYKGCIIVAEQPEGSNLTKVFSNSKENFSIRLPEDYTIDQNYSVELKPGQIIYGVKFGIPKYLTEGTNLSDDTYLSVEQIPNVKTCSAKQFLNSAISTKENGEGLFSSVANFVDAGAGNRYEETVYAIPETNPCLGVRYHVHYSAIENYLDGDGVKEFDKESLIKQFNQIRDTLR